MNPEAASIDLLLDRYDGILLDAYGVLVDAGRALPGAVALIRELDRRGKPYAIVTNDASRSTATYEKRFAMLGLPIPGERVVSSGSLLPGYFKSGGLVGARTIVLGTPDSYDFVRAGGGVPLDIRPGMTARELGPDPIDAVAICDDSGTPFLDGIELALSALVHAVEAGKRPALVVPNPDLVYPKGDGELGFTAGAMALLVEAALARRFPGRGLEFDRLGKPAPHLFLAGAARLGLAIDRVLMIGDQLETDIAGATNAGIASALLAGVSRWDAAAKVAPRYLLATIEPS